MRNFLLSFVFIEKRIDDFIKKFVIDFKEKNIKFIQLKTNRKYKAVLKK